MSENTGKKTFLKSAVILGLAGLIVQVMGAIFRIPLGNIIGDDGMGYYQTAYPIYVALLVFSTNGAPAAISKMTSERIALGHHREAYRVFKLSFILMAILGAVAFAAIFFGAEAIVTALGDGGAYLAMRAIAPALLFVPIMAVFRGYFQGMQDMAPTATSQLAEQAVRVGVGLTLAIILMKQGIEEAAAGATFGTSIGPLFGILVLAVIYFKRKSQLMEQINSDTSIEKESAGSILKTLTLIAVPITIGVSIMPVMNMGDLLVVMRRLQDIGYTSEAANALYGQLSGMAIPVVNVPMALALSMALAMVPAIAAANSVGDKEMLNKNIKLGFRTAMIIGVPCSLGIMSLAEPIMCLLYPMQAESAVNSADCLFILGIGVVFLCVGQTMAGTLQGLGRAGLAVRGLVWGFVVKCIATYILTGIEILNVDGAAWGSVLGFMVICVYNFRAVSKIAEITYDWKLSLLKPVVAGLAMFAVVKLSYFGLNLVLDGSSIATLLSVCVGAGVYGLGLLKINAITTDEIELLPKGKKLAALIRKLHLSK